MWVLPSRGRPHNLRRLIAAYITTKATTPVWLRLDQDDLTLEQSLSLSLPRSWVREIGPRLPLSVIYAEAYQQTPERPWWGFIADDVVPETPGWDVRLIEIAGSDGMAVPTGGHDQEGTPHFVLGGRLVREIGWLALPGLDRLYIDTVWGDIAKSRGLLRRVPDVVLRHAHFSNRQALKDETYKKHNKTRDKSIYDSWVIEYHNQRGQVSCNSLNEC